MEQYSEYIVPGVIIITVLVLIIVIITMITKVVRRIKRSFYSSELANIGRVLKAVDWDRLNARPEPKSVPGATPIYLDRVLRDYPEFHAPEAESAIAAFLKEYLLVRFGEKSAITASNVSDLVREMTVPCGQTGISDIIIRQTAMTGYNKTRDYATITYLSSVGYTVNSSVFETRFETKYTLKIFDRKTASKTINCPNCGGAITDSGNRICPYCGSDVILDTVLSWMITDVKDVG
ncbi:MAG: zinc ribbon domain-containing protein [Oscillospiraceae bacterium]